MVNKDEYIKTSEQRSQKIVIESVKLPPPPVKNENVTKDL